VKSTRSARQAPIAECLHPVIDVHSFPASAPPELLFQAHRGRHHGKKKLNDFKIQHSQFKIVPMAGSVEFLGRLCGFGTQGGPDAVSGEQGLEFDE